MNVFDQVAVTTWDQKVHNSTHPGARLLDGQEPWSERSEATCHFEKIQKIAPRCTEPNSKPQMAMYHDA